jgi:hypothetical protein
LSKQSKLALSEWLLVGSLLIVFASFYLIAKVQSLRFEVEPQARLEPVQISIQGEVKKPGVYLVEPGTFLSEALVLAKPGRFADLASLPLVDPIQASQTIEVPKIKEFIVEVVLEGFSPVQISVAPGARLCDLKSKVAFAQQVHRSNWKSRRLLKPGEKIFLDGQKEPSGAILSAEN